jgi:hypothetical protein
MANDEDDKAPKYRIQKASDGTGWVFVLEDDKYEVEKIEDGEVYLKEKNGKR